MWLSSSEPLAVSAAAQSWAPTGPELPGSLQLLSKGCPRGFVLELPFGVTKSASGAWGKVGVQRHGPAEVRSSAVAHGGHPGCPASLRPTCADDSRRRVSSKRNRSPRSLTQSGALSI